MLKLKNLTVKTQKKKILHNISFTFQKGKVYALMGPNGSGKSTLAQSVMGHPIYTITSNSKITFKGKNIKKLTIDKRAKKGLFLTYQTPLSLSGVNIYQLLQYALSKKTDPLKIYKEVEKQAKALGINENLLKRSLNEDFSGGEKKKMEVLQALIINPSFIFFDEIDTGVDVDALKKIAKALKKMMSKDKTFVLITHYNRILKYIKPDEVLVIVDGKIVKKGKAKLADEIEKKGYEKI